MTISTNNSDFNTGRPASAKKTFYATPDVKPTPIPLNVCGIPEELRAERRWVPWAFVWKADAKGGTWTKVPLSPKTGHSADCNNSCHWESLDECLKLVNAGKADGIGFAFTGSGYVGLDLDDHRDPVTGELSEFAQRVLRTFPTYCEVSASATGAKLVGRGRFPLDLPKKVKELGIELFDRGYFALTGCAVPGAPSEVADLQPIIDARLTGLLTLGQNRTEPHTLKDAPCVEAEPAPGTNHGAKTTAAPRPRSAPSADEVEARVRSHADGNRLMSGDTSAHDHDHSAADLALCGLVAFYAGNNPDLIDAVFRRSGLMRAKWDEQHAGDGRTYAAMTVAKALANKREFFDWAPKVTFRTESVPGSAAPTADPPPGREWPTLAPEAYQGLPGEFVEMIRDQTESDPVALLFQFLVAFGSAVGRSPHRLVEFTQHAANENLVIAGQSAKGRKLDWCRFSGPSVVRYHGVADTPVALAHGRLP